MQMQKSPVLSLSPSLNCYSSVKFSEIASNTTDNFVSSHQITSDSPSVEEEQAHLDQLSLKPPPEDAATNSDAVDAEDDFEFAFVCRDADGSPISADEIFSNGQIRPTYQVFNPNLLFADVERENRCKQDRRPGGVSGGASNRLPLRKLLFEDRDPPSSSSSESDELETVPAESYCVWNPRSVPSASPAQCKKSHSTGSSKRWRFRDFLHRSHSDGKDTFVFLAPEKRGQKVEVTKERRTSGDPLKGKVKVKGSNKETVSPHEMHYVKNRAMKEGDRRRSFLPYRQDLVGFFSNVNGLGKSLNPL